MYIKELSKRIKMKGFRKHGLTWLCQREPFIFVFTIEPGKYCDKNRQYYAMKIGIYSSEVFSLCWDKVPMSKSIKDTDCCLRGGISDFFQENGDIEFYESREITELQERVNSLIANKVIPFFDRITSFGELYKTMLFYEEKAVQKELHQIYIACIEYVMNRKKDALIRLEKIDNQVWKKKTQEVIIRMTNKQLIAENN